VHLNGVARALVRHTHFGEAVGKKITTIEAIAADDKVGKAVQNAWVKHDVAQCGYCQSGQIMSATALAQGQQKTQRRRHRRRHGRQHLPLRHLCAHSRRHPRRSAIHAAGLGLSNLAPPNTRRSPCISTTQRPGLFMPKGLVALMEQAQGAINQE
jgi:hypothetical protein